MQIPWLSKTEVIALSDRTWEVIDPEGLHEADERRWVDEMARQLAAEGPFETVEALRARLDGVCAAVGPAMDSVPPRAIALLMTFLASHPERHHLEDVLLADAVSEASRRGEVPTDELLTWLAERGEMPAPARRRHPLPEALHHIGPRPHGVEDD